MSNEINLLEAAVVTALKADSYLDPEGGTPVVMTIEEKIRPEFSAFAKHELPAIGVLILSGSDEVPTDQTANLSFDFQIPCLIEVVTAGADPGALDTLAKRITSEIRRVFREMKDSGTILAGNALDIDNGSFNVVWREPVKEGDAWIVTSNMELIIYMEVENV